ncbi:MAG: hypothetical protein GY820_34690, partial [Gammaproteobacteria bacterium]|nr:hypothetical protein [Gammaproteobacteria bacterium]
MLAKSGQFLSTLGWSVVLGRSGARESCCLRPSPYMLIVIPQPVQEPDTKAEAHLEELEEKLSQADRHF